MPTSEPPVVPLPPWSVLSPPGVSFPVSGLVSVVVPSPNRAEAFFSVPSRLRLTQLKSPVPRALIFKPSMFLAMVNSFSEAAPLPMGVLEQVDYDCTTKKLYDGDYIVMVSDGVLDNIPCVNKEERMAQMIHALTIREPSAMAEKLLEQSLAYNDMKASDDCTVLVLGLFDTYEK